MPETTEGQRAQEAEASEPVAEDAQLPRPIDLFAALNRRLTLLHVIQLGLGEAPEGDRWLLIQWKPGEGMSTDHADGRITQFVPEHLWQFWLTEGMNLAEQIGLDRVYYRGRDPNLSIPRE